MKYTINYLNSASETIYNDHKSVGELRTMAYDWNQSLKGIDQMVSIEMYYDLPVGCTCRTIIVKEL